MRSGTFTICIAAALILATVGCSKKGSKDSSKADSIAAAAAVAVKVNGRNITAGDIARQENMLFDQVKSLDSTRVQGMIPQIKKQAVENSINRILLEQAVAGLGLTVPPAQVDERIAGYRQNFVSEEAFQADLAKQGLTIDQLKGEVEIGMKAEDLFKRRTANIPAATDKELREFYNGNKERFQQSERVRASHILLTVNKEDAPEVRAQKKKEAEQVLAEIKKGADFAEMARKHSGCPSKEQGGDLGFFERGSMVPEFESVAFTLKKGEMSGVVETPFGYHIIKVTDHAQPSTVPFDQVKQNIAQGLDGQKKQQAIAAYFDSLRSVAKIEFVDSSFVR